MSGFKKLDRHADLMGRMADTLGIDLADAVRRGELSAGNLRSSVFNCLGCGEAAACEKWLQEHAEGADQAPGYCRNDGLFRTLGG